ncbi:pentatricopeptide repeat-containing protein At4g19191, mitochondrial [Typha latifolia]|uniref:pentatricopeptide repeat-containing protein At4g19191, mitochondrial n=1 Tax=Typha latifolia TaxID=4733 RepID=UPI003C304D0E
MNTRPLNYILNPSTVASWNSAIRAATDKGLHREAILIYRRMKQCGLQPDHLTFPFLLKSCARLPDASLAAVFHAHVVKSPFYPDVFVGTAMVDAYVKSRQLENARNLFEEIPNRDAAAWNCIIMGFSELGSLENVLGFFRLMRLDEMNPDSVTVVSLTRSCGYQKKLGLLRVVHCLAIQVGVTSDVSVANTLIAAYCKCEDLDGAELVFAEIPIEMRSVVSWNSMISGYAYVGRSKEVIDFFHQMVKDGLRPDVSTTVSLLSSFASSGSILEGMLVHSLAIKSGMDSDVSVLNTLISLYSKCGDVEAARDCFDKMAKRTCVSWTALISGYTQRGDIDEATNLFFAMEATGERPDAVTVVALLSACSQIGALELGRLMNRYALANGFAENILVGNALIDMYAKCGYIGEAQRLFDSMSERTIISWTAMIMGYAMNGDFIKALDLFTQMLDAGLKPNHVTFLAVLQACVHGGLLEKGWSYFHMMSEMYGIVPRLEHYASMIDLLGRQGRLNEALDFIKSMPLEPDSGVWGALLGACISRSETDIGEYVANRLFELEPQTAVSYVGMANIYAAKERWKGVAEIRTMMKQKKARKSPGQSTVHVDGQFHAFTSEDRFHPEGLHIYEVLDTLALQLKKADQDTDLDTRLHIVELM